MTDVCSNCGDPTDWDADLGPRVLCVACWDASGSVNASGRLRHRRNLRRNELIRNMHRAGMQAEVISARTGLARRSLRRILQGQQA